MQQLVNFELFIQVCLIDHAAQRVIRLSVMRFVDDCMIRSLISTADELYCSYFLDCREKNDLDT